MFYGSKKNTLIPSIYKPSVADLHLQGERWGVTRHDVTSIPSSAEKELEREINPSIGQMKDPLNVFLELLCHTFQIYMHLCHKKIS